MSEANVNANEAAVRFFLGANTPVGFVGYLDDLYFPHDGWRAYIIKSGPGTGKNTLMRAVMRAMTDRGLEVEAIHCSSDPHSLDGVLVPALKAGIIDGTAPHAAGTHTQKSRGRYVHIPTKKTGGSAKERRSFWGNTYTNSIFNLTYYIFPPLGPPRETPERMLLS